MNDAICYKKNYLTGVVARIDFVSPLSILEKTIPAKLSDAITTAFPIVEPSELVNVEFQMHVGDQNSKSAQTRTKQWQFFGRNREKMLTLSPLSINVEYKEYHTFEEVKEEFVAGVESLAKLCPDARVKRFGLRYVNKITKENSTKISDFVPLIAPKLLSTAEFFEAQQHLTRLFHIAELKFEDLDIRFQFGFPNEDYPAAMKRPDFVLDLDGYVQVSHDLNESLRYMDSAHEKIQEIFESSITNVLRGKMNE